VLFALLPYGCSQGPTDSGAPVTAAGSGGMLAGGTGGSVSGGASTGGAGSSNLAGLSGGGTAGAGGASASGSGGVGGTGGTGGALGGSGGAGGAVGGGLCSAGNCADFVGELDGYLFEYPCAGSNCSAPGCMNNALTITKEFKIKGDAGKVYRVDFNVRGITESKNYTGGMRRSTLPIDPGPAGQDLWYEGGTAPVSSYSSYELHVTPPVTGAPNDYFLNARDGTGEHDGSTWALKYQASIKVNGGGTITFKTFDSNCFAIKNCGAGGGCTPRTLDLSDAVPPMTAMQPFMINGVAPQWLHIDVLSVEAL
jgi:hypothetical protein